MGLIFNGNGDVIKAVDGSLTVEGLDFGGISNVNAGIGTFSGNLNVGGVLTYEDVKNVDSVGIVTARAGIVAQDDVTFTGASYNLLWDKSDNALKFSDNALAYFGSDNDLVMHHTGSQGYIKNTTGTLYIQDDTNVIIGSVTGSETGAKYIKDGSFELYHNNIKRLATESNGIYAYGTNHHFVGQNTSGNSNCYLELRSTGSAVYQGLILKNSDASSNVSITSYGGSTMYYSATQHVWSVQGMSPHERIELN